MGGAMGDAARRTARGTLPGRVGYYAGRGSQALRDAARTASGAIPQTVRTAAGAIPQVARTAAGAIPQVARAAAGAIPQVARTAAGAVSQGVGSLARPVASMRGLGVRGSLAGTAALMGVDALVDGYGGAEAVFGKDGTASRETYDTGRNLAGAGAVAAGGGAAIAINTAIDAFVTAGELITDPAKKLNELYSDTTAIDNLHQKIEAFGPITGSIVGSLDSAATGFMRPVDTILKGVAQGGGLLVDTFNMVVSGFQARQAELSAKEQINKNDQTRYGTGAATALSGMDLVEQNRAKDEARLTVDLESLKQFQSTNGNSIEAARAAGISLSGEGRFASVQEEIDFKSANLAGLSSEREAQRAKEKDYTLDFSTNKDTPEFKKAVQELMENMRVEQEAYYAEQQAKISQTTATSSTSSTSAASATEGPDEFMAEYMSKITASAAARAVGDDPTLNNNDLMTDSIDLNTQALLDVTEELFLLSSSIPMIGAADSSFMDELAPIGPDGEERTYREVMNESRSRMSERRSSLDEKEAKKTTDSGSRPIPALNTEHDYNAEMKAMIAETSRTGQSQTRSYDLRDPKTDTTSSEPQTDERITSELVQFLNGQTSNEAQQQLSGLKLIAPLLPIEQLKEIAKSMDPSLTGSATDYMNSNQLIDSILSKTALSTPTGIAQNTRTYPTAQETKESFNGKYVAKKTEMDKKLATMIAMTSATGESQTAEFDLREPAQTDCCDRIVGALEKILAALSTGGVGGSTDVLSSKVLGFAEDPLGSINSVLSSVGSSIGDYVGSAFGNIMYGEQAAQGTLRATSEINANNENNFGVGAAAALNQLPIQEQIWARDEAAARTTLDGLNNIGSMGGTDSDSLTEAKNQGLVSADYTGSFSQVVANKQNQIDTGPKSSNPAYTEAVNQLAYGTAGNNNIQQQPQPPLSVPAAGSILGVGGLIMSNPAIGGGIGGVAGNMNIPQPQPPLSVPAAGIQGTASLPSLSSSPIGLITELTRGIQTTLRSSFSELINNIRNPQTTGGTATAPAVATGLNLLSMDEKTTQFLTGLKDSLGGFGQYVGQLSTAAAQLPDKIEFNGNYNFGVTITGADAFEQMGVSLKNEITSIFQPQIDYIHQQTLGGLGKSPNRPTTNAPRNGSGR